MDMPSPTARLEALARAGAATGRDASAAKDLNAVLDKARRTGGLDESTAREAAEDFESMILSSMLQPMFQGLRTDGPFGGGQGEEMFRSMMIDEFAKSISAQGGIGIADTVIAQLRQMQEV